MVTDNDDKDMNLTDIKRSLTNSNQLKQAHRKKM